MDEIRIVVMGKPEPQGSMSPLPCPRCRIPGRMMADNPRTKGWRDAVKKTARVVMGPRPELTGPVKVEATYALSRPRDHYGSDGRIKARYLTAVPTKRPDVDKLDRALFDALTEVVFHDDALVVVGSYRKRYVTDEESPGIIVRVYPLDTVEDLEQNGLIDRKEVQLEVFRTE